MPRKKTAGRPVPAIPPRQRDGRRVCASNECDTPAEPGKLQCFVCAAAVASLHEDMAMHKLESHLVRFGY